MATVVISGLPQEAQLFHLLSLMKTLLWKDGVPKKFWITSSSDIPDTNFKEVTVNFPNADDAFFAAEVLDNHGFRYKNGTFNLLAYVDTESLNNPAPFEPPKVKIPLRAPKVKTPVNYNQGHSSSVPQRRDRLEQGSYQERYRSQSPHRQSSNLDLELELLRKQRMVIEEERRLLLEKKKLQMVKEYGTSVAEDLGANEDRAFKRKAPPPAVRPRFDHGAPSGSHPRREPPFKPRAANSLPKFIFPCKHLVKDMRSHINRHAPEKSTRKMLIELVKLKLRTRLAVEMESIRETLTAKQICDIYRQKYPFETDGLLVQQAAQSIEMSHLPKVNSKKKRKQTHANPGPQSNKDKKWYIDTVGAGSSNASKTANIGGISDIDMTRAMGHSADESFFGESGEDYNPDDFEDWNTEGDEWQDVTTNYKV